MTAMSRWGRFTCVLPECSFCKQAKAQMLKPPAHPSTPAPHPASVIAGDIGYALTPGPSGERYFIPWISKQAKFIIPHFLRTKDQGLNSFKTLSALVRVQFGRSVGIVRTDNDAVFTSKDFKNYCAANGITQQFSCVGRQSQNGLAERHIGSIKRFARTIMAASSVPPMLWVFAVSYVVYVRNRLPHAGIGGDIPWRRWYQTNEYPSLRHVRPFGCEAFYHAQEQTPGFKPTGARAVFLGFDLQRNGYLVLCLNARRVVTTVDVTFHPGVFPFRDNKQLGAQDWSRVSRLDPLEQTAPDLATHAPRLGVGLPGRPRGSTGERAASTARTQLPERQARVVAAIRAIPDVDSPPDEEAKLAFACIADAEAWLAEKTPPPETHAEIKEHPDSAGWQAACERMIKTLGEAKTWTLVPRKPGVQVLTCKWVFKHKDAPPPKDKKARLTVRGCAQDKNSINDTFWQAQESATGAGRQRAGEVASGAVGRPWRLHPSAAS